MSLNQFQTKPVPSLQPGPSKATARNTIVLALLVVFHAALAIATTIVTCKERSQTLILPTHIAPSKIEVVDPIELRVLTDGRWNLKGQFSFPLLCSTITRPITQTIDIAKHTLMYFPVMTMSLLPGNNGIVPFFTVPETQVNVTRATETNGYTVKFNLSSLFEPDAPIAKALANDCADLAFLSLQVEVAFETTYILNYRAKHPAQGIVFQIPCAYMAQVAVKVPTREGVILPYVESIDLGSELPPPPSSS